MPSIVGGMDIHRKQVTFDYLDLVTGEVKCGQIAPADRASLRAWLKRFAGVPGWRSPSRRAPGGGMSPRNSGGRALRRTWPSRPIPPRRGGEERAKTDRADARLMRDLLAGGRLPSAGSRRRRSWTTGRCWRPITLCAASTLRGCSASTRSCSTRARRVP